MSCTTCGSAVPCNCASTCADTVASSCCQSVIPATPTPFYNCAPACPESHVQKITIQSFSADVKIADSWNIPACDGSAVVNGESLRAIVVGSYLWNPAYGYFEITAFNSGTGQITLLNNCDEGNAAAGTNIPACTEFTVTVPPCDCGETGQVCLEIDFTAPDVSDCIDITLSSTTGIQASFVVQIGTGQYRVSAVKPNNIITICNDGDGITPGTSVIAKNSSGDFLYCLQIISSNPCDADAVQEGNVLVCNELTQIVPLSGAAKGHVLTLIDDTETLAAYRPVGVTDCTTLGAVLNIVAATSVYNGVLVADTTDFSNNDIIEIGDSTLRFTVTSVVDGTHFNLTTTTVPGVNDTLPLGALVCPASCCEQLQTVIDVIETDLACDSQAHRFVIAETVFLKDITGLNIDNSVQLVLTNNLAQVTLPSDCPDALYQVRAVINVAALSDHAANGELLMHEVQINWDDNPIYGRMCWTDFGSDGYDLIPGPYPPNGALDPIWAHLFIASGGWPMMYHAGFIIADTLANPGDTVTLLANYKATYGDNFPPSVTTSTALYMGGVYEVMRVQ